MFPTPHRFPDCWGSAGHWLGEDSWQTCLLGVGIDVLRGSHGCLVQGCHGNLVELEGSNVLCPEKMGIALELGTNQESNLIVSLRSFEGCEG